MKTGNNLSRALILAAVTLLVTTSSTQAQRAPRTTLTGPPTLSLAAEPNVIRACETRPATVQLQANATSSSGNALRYRWTVDGGTLTGKDATTTWDLMGARPGTYHAVADVDEGDEDCAAF
ncbi:MAG TPA: hypothetical protein VGP81_06540, partial [Pyrinomonadaceae bacterium]|nr:hypothetical protein [Pyrinomonadaceae bacterium]